MSHPDTLPLRYRLAVASRVLAAALGGYAVAAASTRLLSLTWPAPPSQAVMWASMLSFVIWAVAVLWVFATRSAWRAWWGLSAATGLVVLAEWLLRAGGWT